MPDTEKTVQTQNAVETVEQMQSLDTLADDIHRHIVSTLGNEVYGTEQVPLFQWIGLQYPRPADQDVAQHPARLLR